MAHRDVIGPALEHIGLGQLDTTDFWRLKPNFERVLPVLELPLTGHQGHGRLVIGQGAARHADEAGLGQINPIFAFVKQDEALVGGLEVGVLGECGANQGAAFGVKVQSQDVGLDLDAFTG